MTQTRLLVDVPSVCGLPPARLVGGSHPLSHVYPDPGPDASILGYGALNYGPPGTYIGDFTGDDVADGMIVLGCRYDSGSSYVYSSVLLYGADGSYLGRVPVEGSVPSSWAPIEIDRQAGTRIARGRIKLRVWSFRDSDPHCCASRVNNLAFEWNPSGLRAPRLDYFALGDSYSSGEGVRPYMAGTDTPSNKCHRSTSAYARQLRLPGRSSTVSSAPGALRFLACSGAVINNLLGELRYGEQGGLPAIDASGLRADLVTLTVGGNDMLFSPVLTVCALYPRCGSLPVAASPSRTLRDTFPQLRQSAEARLRILLAGLRWRSRSVWLLGYPMLFPDSRQEQTCAKLRLLFSPGEQNMLREEQRAFQDMMRRLAAETGVHYVDMASPSCSRDGWGWSVNDSVGPVGGGSGD